MTKGHPDRAEAEKIWQDGINHHLAKPYGFNMVEEYKKHSRGVGKAAETIAAKVLGMDSEKAFVLGLLHDYGKRVDEKIEQVFHGRDGYEELMRLGYPTSARICLTHTFPNKNFTDDEFVFPKDWIDWAKTALSTVEYDDYDLLIIMCDKMFEAGQIIPMEKRVDCIVNRYNLPKHQKEMLLIQSSELRKYFTDKLGKDVYDVLGIKE